MALTHHDKSSSVLGEKRPDFLTLKNREETWLVVLFPIYGKMKFMFQTTNHSIIYVKLYIYIYDYRIYIFVNLNYTWFIYRCYFG
jgi:hypothetical protein